MVTRVGEYGVQTSLRSKELLKWLSAAVAWGRDAARRIAITGRAPITTEEGRRESAEFVRQNQVGTIDPRDPDGDTDRQPCTKCHHWFEGQYLVKCHGFFENNYCVPCLEKDSTLLVERTMKDGAQRCSASNV